MFIKRKRLNPDGGSGKEQDEREINNPDLNELLGNIDSAVKEADASKQRQLNNDCGCFGKRKG